MRKLSDKDLQELAHDLLSHLGEELEEQVRKEYADEYYNISRHDSAELDTCIETDEEFFDVYCWLYFYVEYSYFGGSREIEAYEDCYLSNMVCEIASLTDYDNEEIDIDDFLRVLRQVSKAESYSIQFKAAAL